MKKLVISSAIVVAIGTFFWLQANIFDDIGHFFTSTLPSGFEKAGDAIKSGFEDIGKGFEAMGNIIYKEALKPAAKAIGEGAIQFYEHDLKPVGEGLAAAGKATGTFFKETVYEKGLKEGLYEKGLRDTVYEKGLKETIYEKGLKETVYEQGLKKYVYEEGLKKYVYETFLRDMVYKVGLNWVGEKVLIPTLIKVLIPALQWTMDASNKIADGLTTAYDTAFKPWVGPIWEKAMLPVLGPTWNKVLNPLLTFANDKILKPTEHALAKVLDPAIDQLLYPLRKFQDVLNDADKRLIDAQTLIQGDFLYQTDAQGQFVLDAQGEKVPQIDKDGVPIPDPNHPALPDRIINVIMPVYGLVAQLNDSQEGSSFIDVVGTIVVNIYELRKQIAILQQELTQQISDLQPEEQKTLQDALQVIDTNLKELAEAVTLSVDQKQGYQLVRPANPTKKLDSVFCPEQGGTMCKIVYTSVAAKLTYDLNLSNINKLMDKLGNDINAGSSTCTVCHLANIADKDCTFPMRLQLASGLVNQLANFIIRNLLEKLANLEVTELVEILAKNAVMDLLPSNLANTLRNVKHGLGK